MNYKQKLLVSEPWDFKSQSGCNMLIGRVVEKVDSYNLIFESDELVCSGEFQGKLMVLSTRYTDDSFISEPYAATVNGGLLLDIDYENKSSDELKKNCKFILIGALT